jgi:hypothetical protein
MCYEGMEYGLRAAHHTTARGRSATWHILSSDLDSDAVLQ